MQTAVDVLSLVGAAAFVLLALVTTRTWRARGGDAAGWAAATFATLGVVALVGQFFPEEPHGAAWEVATKALIAVLVVFPYFLFRFAVTFQPASTLLETVAGVSTAVVVVWAFLLPRIPPPDEPRPGWLTAFVGALVVQWTLLFVVVALRLWRAGRAQPTVARRRMRTLALGAGGMAITIIVSGSSPSSGEASWLQIGTQSATLLTALLFFFGFAPPRALRISWRQAEYRAFQAAVADLMKVTTADEVAEVVLPHLGRIMGGRGSALIDRSGRVVRAWGVTDDEAARALRGNGDRPLSVPVRSGALAVWASPYTPFFGQEELGLMRSLSGLADLALERAALFARERAFIANAAHELRTPLAALTGLTATLTTRHDGLSEQQVDQVLEAMGRQGERAASLIDRMLDLSFIEHTRIVLEDVPLAPAIKRAVAASPPPEGVNVEVQVGDSLVVRAEPERFEQVMVNLLNNAYRHGAPPVAIHAEAHADVVEIRITDAGPGIPEQVADSVFEPFSRHASSETPGAGLGLAIARRFVEAFGGTLRYEPGEQRGARFVITLQRAPI